MLAFEAEETMRGSRLASRLEQGRKVLDPSSSLECQVSGVDGFRINHAVVIVLRPADVQTKRVGSKFVQVANAGNAR